MAGQPIPGEDSGRAAAGRPDSVNQARHEPVPASRQDERPQAAGQRSEDVQRHVEQARRGAADEDRRPALDRLGEPPGQPAPTAPGAAAEEIMGGPGPQGPVADAPAVQVARAEGEDGQATSARFVSNAVPGKPDGEVDTRS